MQQQFSPLYKMSNGKKYGWSISVQSGTEGRGIIRTSHGEIGGKQVVHERVITEGKVKRNAFQQAVQEAQRKWLDKKDKELYMPLDQDSAEPSDNNGETPPTKEPKIRPMLAQKFEFAKYAASGRSHKIPIPGASVQPKLDGLRCLTHMSSDGHIVMESRTGVAFKTLDHIKQMLQAQWTFCESIYLDGEIYVSPDIMTFEEISGLTRSHTISSYENTQMEKLQYHIYDMVDLSNPNMTFTERDEWLRQNIQPSETIRLVETVTITRLDEVQQYHDRYVEQGYEGIMVRDSAGLYEINKRSRSLQKFKMFDDDEFRVVGFHTGEGHEQNAVIWDCVTADGKPFSCRPKGTVESREALLQVADQYVGKMLTVKYQGLTDGNLRFPVGLHFRHDL